MPDAIRQDCTGPYVAGLFRDQGAFLSACRAARAGGHADLQAWSPWPVPGLDAALGLERSRIGRPVLMAIVLGAAACLAFQYHQQVLEWPMVYGGKPYSAWMLWMVPTLEAGLLLGGLVNLLACFACCRLLPDPYTRLPDPRLGDDRLCLALGCAGRDPGKLEAWLRANGAEDCLLLAPGAAVKGEPDFAPDDGGAHG